MDDDHISIVDRNILSPWRLTHQVIDSHPDTLLLLGRAWLNKEAHSDYCTQAEVIRSLHKHAPRPFAWLSLSYVTHTSTPLGQA